MENDNNWSHRQENDGPQEYTQHPTGARFIPEQSVNNDKYIASKPEKLEALQDSEKSFDSFNDTDPNRYNNNAGLGIRTDDEHKNLFNDEAENEFILRDYLNDNFESNEFDGNSKSDSNDYPKYPEF